MKKPDYTLPWKPSSWIILALLIAIGSSGCEQTNTYVEPPPPEVTLATPLQETITDYLEFTGTTAALQKVEARARVPGFLESMHFTPGTRVKQGDLLFVIDPREYKAELSAVKAEVEAATAELERATIELDRAEALFKKNAGSEAEVVKWRGEKNVAAASLIRAKARVESAELNLDYTQVKAAISGRVSRNYVDVGNLVGEKEATLLTDITQMNPIYAYFNLNERDLIEARELYRKRVEETGVNPDKQADSEVNIPVELGLGHEEGFPHVGELDFAESDIDTGTGTLQLRAIFSNPGRVSRLLPGLFARIRMPIRERDNALLVTERAIGSDQSGQYLMVVNSDNTVEKRNIRAGQTMDGLSVIEEGIQANDRVVVKGIQRARPGGKVNPTEIDMTSLKTSALKRAAEASAKDPSLAAGSSDAASASDQGK